MSGLETVVRPFAQPAVFNTQKIVPAVPQSVSAARLKWGDVGTLPSPVSALAAFNLSQEAYTETSRKTQNVTVANPSNPSDTVVVARALTLNFDKSITQNELTSSLTADLDVAFNQFAAEIQAAFKPFDPDSSSGTSKVVMNFHPPDLT